MGQRLDLKALAPICIVVAGVAAGYFYLKRGKMLQQYPSKGLPFKHELMSHRGKLVVIKAGRTKTLKTQCLRFGIRRR